MNRIFYFSAVVCRQIKHEMNRDFIEKARENFYQPQEGLKVRLEEDLEYESTLRVYLSCLFWVGKFNLSDEVKGHQT